MANGFSTRKPGPLDKEMTVFPTTDAGTTGYPYGT